MHINTLELKFTNSDNYGYTYDTEVYLGKDRKRATTDMTVTHTTVRQLTKE